MLELNLVLSQNIEYDVIIIQWKALISSNIFTGEQNVQERRIRFSIRNLTPANSFFLKLFRTPIWMYQLFQGHGKRLFQRV